MKTSKVILSFVAFTIATAGAFATKAVNSFGQPKVYHKNTSLPPAQQCTTVTACTSQSGSPSCGVQLTDNCVNSVSAFERIDE